MPYEIIDHSHRIEDGRLILDDPVVAESLNLSGYADLLYLPEGLRVGGNLVLGGCSALKSLPDGLHVGGTLYLTLCASLKSLSEGLMVGGSLHLARCHSLEALPDGLTISGFLNAYRCEALTSLPERLKVGGCLTLQGCSSLSMLPGDLQVGSLQLDGMKISDTELFIHDDLPLVAGMSCIGRRVGEVIDHYLLRGTHYEDLFITARKDDGFKLSRTRGAVHG